MRTTALYHTPYRSEEYLDAMSNLALMGYNEIDILQAIIKGIHERTVENAKVVWVQSALYDFPFDPEMMTLQNWEDFLTHYYAILEKHICSIIKPFNQIPRGILVANIDYNEMVIDYEFLSMHGN